MASLKEMMMLIRVLLVKRVSDVFLPCGEYALSVRVCVRRIVGLGEGGLREKEGQDHPQWFMFF